MYGIRPYSSRYDGIATKTASRCVSRCKAECGYRLDLLIENEVIVEIKSVEKLLPIHKAQLMSYLKLADCKVGLLINFNVELLKDGIQRVVINFPDSQRPPRPLR